MAKKLWRKAAPLALAGLLVLNGCDDEEEKPPEVTVEVEKGTNVIVKHKDKDEMIVVGELALFTVVIVWALFGPGAARRFSENR